MSHTTVYSSPTCARCRVLKNHLQKNGVPFDSVDITLDEESATMLAQQGFTELPVVNSSSTGMFSGFRADKLQQIVSDYLEPSL